MRTALLLALVACGPAADDDADDTAGPTGTDDSAPVDLSSGGPGDPAAVRDATGAVVFAGLSDGPGLRGPGGPAATFTDDDLWTNCAPLPGGEVDINHHNLVVPYRGHLVLPWAPETGLGGVSFFEVDDPCHPVKVGEGTSPQMRETHAMGFFHLPDDHPHAGEYGVVNGIDRPLAGPTGLQIWDITDVAAPEPVAFLPVPEAFYPDSYNIVTLAVFVQFPYVYTASSGAGVDVVDVSDPTTPVHVTKIRFDDGLLAGGVFVLGNRMVVTSAEGSRVAQLDVTDPADPQFVPGGSFDVRGADGATAEHYHANLAGHLALFARKQDGGGPMVYDLTDPAAPRFVGEKKLPFMNGGYVFYDEGVLFTGDSNAGHVVRMTGDDDWETLGVAQLDGDLDTLTPYGNVAIVAVDSPGPSLSKGEASQVMPWTEAPDATPIGILATDPTDGATAVGTTARVGIGFDEMVEPGSVFPGSIRVFADDGTPVPGWTSVQENTASFAPRAPLARDTTYTVEVLAGGPTDVNGNALAATTSFTFTTVP